MVKVSISVQGERRGNTALDTKTQTRHKGFAEHSRRTRKSGGERPLLTTYRRLVIIIKPEHKLAMRTHPGIQLITARQFNH